MKFLIQLLLIGTTLFLGACKLNPQNLKQNGSLLDTYRCVKSNTGLYYSHLADPASQEEVKTALLEAGISEQNIQKFFAQVTHFNQLVGKEYLITSGFVHTDSLSPAYDIEQIISNWQEKSPFFIGYNCRITAFSLMKDNIHIAHPEQANARELFMDKDALATSPETLLNTQEQQAFESFYSLVPTITTKDPAVHSSKIKQSRAEKGISFQTSPASLISVWFHSHLEGEEDYLFIGHIGVLIQRKHDLLFIEKLAFDEPYQASIFSTRTELAHYLRAKYDTAYNQPTASPLLRENDKLLDETCRTTNQT